MIIDLLKRITNSLDNKKISYMLSGGLALSAYSIPRMTLDIDLIVELYPQNINDFLSVFNDNFYINSDVVKSEVLRTGMFNAIDHVTGFKIDFIVRKNSEYRINEFKRRRQAKIADLDLWIVAPEDLVISKIEWIQQYQSDKQIEDIKNLLSLDNIDHSYIRFWCSELKLKTFKLLDNV